jgi:hypothetical protein
MKIENCIYEYYTKYKLKINVDENDSEYHLNNLIVNYFHFNKYYESKNGKFQSALNENSVIHVNYEVTLKYDEAKEYLNKIVEEMKKIENDEENCNVVVSLLGKYYEFKADDGDVESLFTNLFSKHDSLVCDSLIIRKTQDGIILSDTEKIYKSF